jgi:prevent-host-death family protein
MATIGIRELKNQLSRYVALAKGGERVVVTEHGVPVAILSAIDEPSSKSLTLHEKIAKLEAEGFLIVGERGDYKPKMPTVRNRGPILASDIVSEDRK